MTAQEREMVMEAVAEIERIADQLQDCRHLQITPNAEASYGNLKGMADQFGRQLAGRISTIRNILSRPGI